MGRLDLVHLIVSTRTPEDLYYAAELADLRQTVLYTRRAPEGWPRPAGRLTERRFAGVDRGGDHGFRLRFVGLLGCGHRDCLGGRRRKRTDPRRTVRPHAVAPVLWGAEDRLRPVTFCPALWWHREDERVTPAASPARGSWGRRPAAKGHGTDREAGFDDRCRSAGSFSVWACWARRESSSGPRSRMPSASARIGAGWPASRGRPLPDLHDHRLVPEDLGVGLSIGSQWTRPPSRKCLPWRTSRRCRQPPLSRSSNVSRGGLSRTSTGRA